MDILDKWADKIYSETDFGRSIATSIAGCVGLSIYLYCHDWVIASFSSIIVFPILRILASKFNDDYIANKIEHIKANTIKSTLNKLSQDELNVLNLFVENGGTALTWSIINKSDVSSASIETLIQREILSTSATADGMKETFVLDVDIYDTYRKTSN